MELTRQQVLVMEAGPELDAAIDEFVMGKEILTPEFMRETAEAVWENQPSCTVFWGFVYRDGRFERTFPAYSTNIAVAWGVLQKIHHAHRCDVELLLRDLSYLPGSPLMYMCMLRGGSLEYDSPNLTLGCNAETAPLAICRAALLAKIAERDGGK